MEKHTLTKGNVSKGILLFVLPIIAGSLIQQLYVTIDAVVVGQFTGKLGLAAIDSVHTLFKFPLNFMNGLATGATILISGHCGSGDKRQMHCSIRTACTVAVILGVVCSVGGVILTPWMLQIMSVPDEVYGRAFVYTTIYFGGIWSMILYNMTAGILRAYGDSKRPLYFLIASCLTNIVLDIAFVIGLHMGVAGAALATILSQALSAVLVLWVLMRTKDMHRLELRKIRFDGRMFRRIIRIGLPAGLQSVMYTSSNILIQSSVNALGTDTVAAWTAYSKIDSLFWMIVNAFGISITTFVGQNYGAGKMDRVHKGVRTCMEITAGATVLLSVILYNYASICYQLFTTDAQVVVIGEQILHFLVPTYFTYIAIEILSGTLRGIGDSWLPMIICCLGICALRVVWILTAVPLKNDILTIVFSYPLTWTVTSIAFIVYYLFFSRLKIVERKR